jgi:restriction system protein
MSVGIRSVSSIPAHVEMYWPTLQALKDMGGSGTIQEIDERVTRIAGFTEAQQSILHQGGPQTEIAYRLAWVRTHLKLLGAI